MRPATKITLSILAAVGGALVSSTLPAAAAPLGITCAAESGWGPKSAAVDAALTAAEEAGNWAAAIEAQRVMVAEQCDNSYLWIRLALFYARAGRAKEAFEAGAHTLAQFPNDFAASLEQEEESLAELRALPGYAESALGRELAAKMAAREERTRQAKAALAALKEGERPPALYIAKDACPFECCSFGEWTAEAEVPLYKAPVGEKLGRSLAPGEVVTGVTGEVHLQPRPMLVGHALAAETELGSDQRIAIAAGELVFELDALGEGFMRFWYRGKTFEAPLGMWGASGCLVFSEECWGDYLEPEAPIVHDWWVKLRTKDGQEVWAREEGLTGMYGCG